MKYEASSQPLNVSVLTDNSDESTADQLIDTADCGKTLGCLSDPENCKDNRDCNYLVTFKNISSALHFSVSGKTDGWIAVGFNNKPKMGNTDSVICQKSNKEAKLWTAKLQYSSPKLEKSNETKLLKGISGGGIVYCSFFRPLQPKSNKMLDISAPRYIIYAKGGGTSSLNKHEGTGSTGCSKIKVDFSVFKRYKLNDCHGETLSKVHGSFMIFAWMVLVFISIFIARYSRPLWGNLKILGKDAWFQFHRSLMGFAVFLTVSSIVIIFVHKEGWSESAGDHAVFGIIVLVLAVIQPTIAFFRPHPGSHKRPIFDWLHRTIALIVVLMAVVTVFKGADLLEEDGGDVASKILIALLVFGLITALVLEFLAYRVRTQKLYIVPSNENMEVEGPDAQFWETKAQRLLLIPLSVVVFILAVIMIAFVAGAGMDDDDDDDDD